MDIGAAQAQEYCPCNAFAVGHAVALPWGCDAGNKFRRTHGNDHIYGLHYVNLNSGYVKEKNAKGE